MRLVSSSRGGLTAATAIVLAGLLSFGHAADATGITFSDADATFDQTGAVNPTNNRTGLIIDWTPTSGPSNFDLVRTYQWNWDPATTPTAENLLRDVAAQDDDLFLKLIEFNFGGSSFFTNGFGYDVDQDGFSINDGTDTLTESDFTDGVFEFANGDPVATDAFTSVDPDDNYLEGLNNANWAFFEGGSGDNEAGPWSQPGIGITDFGVVDDGWIGFRFDPDGFGGNPVSTPALPVPGAAPLGVAALSLLVLRRRRRRQQA